MPRAKEVTPSVVINTGAPPETKPEIQPKAKIDFWTQLRELSPQDWTRHLIYLYRTKPLVGMKVKEKYLDVFAQPFTIEDVKVKYGGEEFKAMLTRDGKMTATEEFAIEAPPKFDLSRENPMGDGARPAAAAPDSTKEKIVDQFLVERRSENDMLAEAHRRSLDIVTDGFKTVQAQAARTESNGGDSQLINTIRVLKELGLVGAPPPDPFASMMKMMEFAKTMGFVGGGGNALTGLKDQIELIKSLADAVGSGGGGKTDVWGTLAGKVPEIIDGLGNIVGRVKDVQTEATKQLSIKAQAAERIAQINAARTAAGQQPLPAEAAAATVAATEAPAVPGTILTPPHPGGGLHTVSMGAAPEDAAPNGNWGGGSIPSEAAVPAPSLETQEATLVTFLKHKVVEMISKSINGSGVLQFVEDFDERIIAYLVSIGPEGLEKFFAQDPILVQAMPLPQWAKWYQEACEDLYTEVPEVTVPN